MPILLENVFYVLFDSQGNLVSVEQRAADDFQVARNVLTTILAGFSQGSIRFSTAAPGDGQLENRVIQGYIDRSPVLTEQQREEFTRTLAARTVVSEIRFGRAAADPNEIAAGTVRVQEQGGGPARKVITYFVDP